ncbi:hypothetical protein Hamer_G013363 [Homarus americanus]|uniref:Uncharacterized protein n=1 Tax=Homarus americanus TaxID=6706 RepID=A0A8J5MZB7_HOMAM|nr:hypothetical protein Hamer_G013363 [Homarus americanus]
MKPKQIHIIGGGLQNTNKSNSEATLHCLRKAEVESSRPSDWKDELRDIQAAHVEQEVAKFQQTIDETQRRWEENYARVVPRSTHTNGQSDSSTEVLHNPRVGVLSLIYHAYLVPPRHDLWRTVSEDTIAAQPRDRTVLQPFLRHTSVDNLQPSTKVSNLRNLGSLPQQNMNSMNSVSSMSNININSVTGLGKSANYQHQTHYNRSMESMSTYSDGESQGEGIDSDASTRTPDEMPVLPSVRKLACKFDQASQERVNDLDKRGKDNALSYYGKKNILLIEKSTFSDQPYTRSFTNNLNKRTEKPYIVKEVRPLPGGEDSHPATVTDTYDSDIDSSDFDDQATVTSLSLPPTPASLNDKHSFSTPSLIDTDSCYSVDDRDLDQTTSCDQFGNKIIFGVTLRRTNTSPTNSADSRKHASVSCISSVEGQINYRNRRLSSTSTVDLEREVTPSDSDSDAPNALRQSTIIKLHHGSNLDLSHQDSNNLRHQKKYYSSLDLSSVSKSTETKASEASLETNKARAIKQTVLSNWPLNRQISLPNVYTLSGPAFVPKGRRRMCDFLNSYSGHKSLHEMNPIDEKIEEDLRNQKHNDKHKQQRYSVPVQPKESLNKKSTFKKSKSEGSLKAPNKDTTDSSLLQDNTCRDTQVWQMGARNKSGSTINDVSSKLPKHAKTVSDSATTENSLQTSRNNLTPSSFTNDLVTSPVNDSQEVVLNSEDEELPYASLNLLPQTFSTNVADDDASSHTSDGTYTAPVTQTMEGDQLKIKLNENHVSLFQSNLEEDSQTPTGSTIEIPDFRDQPVKINKVIKKKSASNTTGVHPLRKQRSIGDLLKEYSNLKSLDEKSAFRNVKVIPNVTKTESNKTIITISDDEMKLQPKIQIIAKSKDSTWVTPPTTWAAVNTKLSPVTSKHNKSLTIVNYKEPAEHLEDDNSKGTNDGNENVKTMKPIDKEPTEDLWDEIQTARNMSPNNKIPDSAGTSTVISVPDTEALLSNATPVFHASIVYVGNDVKDNHDDSSRSNIYDKVSSINKDINGNMNIVNAPIKQSSPECSLGDITVNGLRAETKITSPSIQSEFVRGPGSPITDTSCTSPELEQKDVHIVKEDSNEMPNTKGPHVTVIPVTEAPDNPSPSHKHNVTSSSPGNSSDEDIPFDDPIALTRMIVSSSRAGSSNKQRAAKRQNIKKATVPLNSPFSPLRQKAKHPVNVTKTSIIEVGPIKKQLGPRDSYDEGVHSQFSDMEMAPSATSLESKSTSSLDIVGEEGREPMV